MRLVFLFDQERRWRVERGAQGAKSLTPGFNSNRLLGKASDGNGQAWCRGKRGSSSEVHSNRAPFSDSKPLDLPGKHISDAALGLDHLRRAWIVLQFAAKAESLHVNARIEHVFVDSGCLQKLLSAKRPLGSVEERDEQRVFAFGHRNVRAIRIGEPSGAQIELPAGKPIAAAFWLPPGEARTLSSLRMIARTRARSRAG